MNKKIPIVLAAVAAMVAVAGAAEARDGCGMGAHRGPWGHCRPNAGPGFVAPGGWVVDRYYPGRGYWDGHHWWHHREHRREGWRYW